MEKFFTQPIVVIALVLWSIFWKGLALWKAARKGHLTWFIILFLVNTVGLLEIAYVFYLNRFELGSRKLLTTLEKKFQS
jgi:hypothetical protein